MRSPKLAMSVVLSVIALSAQAGSHELIKTSEGYPYNRMVHMAEEVKLSYSQNQNQIKCKIAVKGSGYQYNGEQQVSSVATFEATPLAACINRTEAKLVLAQLHQHH